jgi:serine/threonine protein kinase
MATDMYSLGVLLYYMFFGIPPYIYPNLFQQNDKDLLALIKGKKMNLQHRSIQLK